MLHTFTVNIEAQDTHYAAEMCKVAMEALQGGTLRLQEERARGNVRYAWEPGVHALAHPGPSTFNHRLSQAIPSLYDVLTKPGAVCTVDEGRAGTLTVNVTVRIPGGTYFRFAVSGNEAVLIRTEASAHPSAIDDQEVTP